VPARVVVFVQDIALLLRYDMGIDSEQRSTKQKIVNGKAKRRSQWAIIEEKLFKKE
jgi:hypothetical protein